MTRPSSSSARNQRGLLVTDVTAGGPGWGELADPDRGGPDIILEVEGKPVKTTADAARGPQGHEAGRHREPAGLQHAGEDPADGADQAGGVISGSRRGRSPGEREDRAGQGGRHRRHRRLAQPEGAPRWRRTRSPPAAPRASGSAGTGRSWSPGPPVLHGDSAVERGRARRAPRPAPAPRRRSDSPPVRSPPPPPPAAPGPPARARYSTTCAA